MHPSPVTPTRSASNGLRTVARTLGLQLRLVATAITVSLGLVAVGQVADAATAMVKVDDNSFKCMRQMAQVRHFYVDNLLGDVMSTVTAANAPKGAIYPVGSVVQLVPTEAMVKREAGFSPAELLQLARNGFLAGTMPEPVRRAALAEIAELERGGV